jgi:hypothetical protein
MNEKIKEMLEKLAKRKCWSDTEDFNPMDMSGGNFDDAYFGGHADGQAELAQDILAMLEEKSDE